MAKIEWSSEYRSGSIGADYEHEALMRRLGEILASIRAQTVKSRVIDGLGEVYGSIAAHFALEEQLMQRHGYQAYREHKADHDRLLDEIRARAAAFTQSATLDAAAFEQKLADWFHHHFTTHDARLHRVASMRQPDPVSQSTLEGLARFAGDELLRDLAGSD